MVWAVYANYTGNKCSKQVLTIAFDIINLFTNTLWLIWLLMVVSFARNYKSTRLDEMNKWRWKRVLGGKLWSWIIAWARFERRLVKKILDEKSVGEIDWGVYLSFVITKFFCNFISSQLIEFSIAVKSHSSLQSNINFLINPEKGKLEIHQNSKRAIEKQRMRFKIAFDHQRISFHRNNLLVISSRSNLQ